MVSWVDRYWVKDPMTLRPIWSHMVQKYAGNQDWARDIFNMIETSFQVQRGDGYYVGSVEIKFEFEFKFKRYLQF